MLCDFPSCSSDSTSEIIRLACFHTCHRSCLEKNEKLCLICKDPFLKRVNELSDSFNKGLLENDTSPNITDSRNSHEQPESQPDINSLRNADFYKSDDWENMITRNLEQLIIPQPSVPHRTTQERRQTTERPATATNSRRNHCSHCGQPGHTKSRGSRIICPYLMQSNNQSQQQTPSSAQKQSSNSSVPPQSTSIHVPSSMIHSVTFWELPFFLSQSTIGGRQGNNACTVISLLMAKTYLTNKSLLTLNNDQPLSPSWILAFMSCMMGGNQVYDRSMQSPSYLGVVEAIPLVRCSLGSVSYEQELTVCFVKEPNSREESALSFHLSRRLNNTNAAFTIIRDLTITFVSDSNGNIILMDSHLHHPRGALVAKTTSNDIEVLLKWLKVKLSTTVNLCTVTFINF